MPEKKPNILVMWGDDIGWWNISANNRGMMGYRTPNIDRIAQRGRRLHRLLRPAELHRRPRRLHHRAEPAAHRPHQGRGCPARTSGCTGGPDDRRAAQAARLRDRPVRQEPPGRPGRVPADDARLRRVLRQPLPPERRGGARAPGLPEGPRVPEAVRAARRAPLLGRRQAGRSRGHRSAHEEADGDDRRRGRRRTPCASSTTPTRRTSPSSSGGHSTRMHFRTHPPRSTRARATGRGTTTT